MMKSIVEEASSIAKAIEKAWIRAGKPTRFQIKILEEPKRNFLGWPTQSGKIGLFFVPVGEEIEKQVKSQELHKERRFPLDERAMPVKKEETFRRERKPRVQWTQETTSAAKEWLDKALAAVGRSNISFSIEPRGYYLRILFSKPIIEDWSKEQQLFRCFAYLLIQALRTKFKRGFTGYKVVLKSA